MTREEKIAAIYAEMANKKRTFGCRCKRNDGEDVIFIRKNKKWEYLYMRRNKEFTIPLWYAPKVIWHPVMIGDVLDWIDNKMGVSNCEYEEFVVEEANISVLLWREYLKPIEEQSDECVDYIYSLISKGNE